MTVPLIAVQVRIEATRKRHYQPPPPRARIQFNLPSVRPVVDLKRIASGDKDD